MALNSGTAGFKWQNEIRRAIIPDAIFCPPKHITNNSKEGTMQTPDGQRLPMCEEDSVFMDEVVEVLQPGEMDMVTEGRLNQMDEMQQRLRDEENPAKAEPAKPRMPWPPME